MLVTILFASFVLLYLAGILFSNEEIAKYISNRCAVDKEFRKIYMKNKSEIDANFIVFSFGSWYTYYFIKSRKMP